VRREKRSLRTGGFKAIKITHDHGAISLGINDSDDENPKLYRSPESESGSVETGHFMASAGALLIEDTHGTSPLLRPLTVYLSVSARLIPRDIQVQFVLREEKRSNVFLFSVH